MQASILEDSVVLIDVVNAAQRGDREAFGRLAARYERAVYAVALRRLGDHAEAQELCQEVFVQAMRKLSQLRQPERFGGWLRSIAVRMAINRAVRRPPPARGDVECLEAATVERATPLGSVLASEERQQVRRGLRRLGTIDRETLVAFYFEGESLLEMSERFQSPIGTIKRRLHTARKRLAKELQSLAPA